MLEAVAFVKYTMGIEECSDMLRGRRCWGAASSDAVKEKSQASPLTVKELQILHSVLHNDTDVWNQAFAGMVLFVAYARARWTDAQQASALLFDRDDSGDIIFVEASTGVHKTIHALQHRHQFLPLVAPALGVSNDNWAEKWEQVRNQLGMKLGPGCPLLPAPLEDRSFGKRMLSSQECSKWLRALINRQIVIDEQRKITSHSLKCTSLSMLAKRGVSMEDRLILGYHTSPFKVGLTYSRDAMSRPLMILEKLFAEIRQGKFNPDVTRSGRFASDPGSCEAGQSVEKTKIEITSDEESGWRIIEEKDAVASSEPAQTEPLLPIDLPFEDTVDFIDLCTESSASSVESDDPEGFQNAGKKVFNVPAAPVGFHMWQHSKSKILHLMEDGHNLIFECGRKAGKFHSKENVVPRWDSGICWKCFKRS